MHLWQDVRMAARHLANDHAFATVVVLTLALGIGASTATFTVIDSVLLRPLRFAEPQRLTMIRPTSGSRLSLAYLYEWRLQTRTFDDLAGWRDARANVTGRGAPFEVLADRATTNFFAVLGIRAFAGRTFTTHTDLSNVEPEVVLSHGFWQRRYGGDPAVVGQPITVDGAAYTIVGVMPDGFVIRTTELAESRAELWIPLPLVPGDRTGMGGALHVLGRLEANVTVNQAQTDLTLIARRIEAEYPSYSRDWGVGVVPLLDATVRDVRSTLLLLFGAVGILLLIACVNVANLALSRVAQRQTELAIRVSLGATGRRLVRQLLTESFLLATAGGALGVLLAWWATELLVSALPPGLELPRAREIGVDLRILGFACLITVLTAVLFGIVPAVSSARLASNFRFRHARGSSEEPGRNRIRSLLIISEVALAMVLLAGAGLLGRSLWELTRVDPGFQPQQVLTMRTTLPAAKYDTDDQVRAFGRALVDRTGTIPGVSHVGFTNYLPMSRFGIANRFEIQGRPEERTDDQKFSWVGIVGGRYFEAMGISLLRGRLPGDADTEATEPVFVIDDALAQRYWPDTDPVGARLTWPSDSRTLSGPIIGVVRSVRWEAMSADPPASAYWWFPHAPGREFTVVARTDGDPTAIAGVLAATVREIDPNQPVAEIRTMEDVVSADLARPRFTMILLGSFAAAALLLAAIGLYGVIAFAVAQRTREIGIRAALGAQPADVFRLVLQRGLTLVGAGLVVGGMAALALGRVVAGLLYEVSPRDPLTLLSVAALLTGISIAAICLPARRATRIDPLAAIRTE